MTLILPLTGLLLVTGCAPDGDVRTPVAAAAGSAPAAPRTSPTAQDTPTSIASPADVAAIALALLARRAGGVASMAPTTGAGKRYAAVVRTVDTTRADVKLLVWRGGSWLTQSRLTLDEPLQDRDGGPVQWRRVTGGEVPDALVWVQGGSLHRFTDVAIARHDGASWAWVEHEDPDSPDSSSSPLYGDPLFAAGVTFVTRSQAAGQVVPNYWTFDPASGTFRADPGAAGAASPAP